MRNFEGWSVWEEQEEEEEGIRKEVCQDLGSHSTTYACMYVIDRRKDLYRSERGRMQAIRKSTDLSRSLAQSLTLPTLPLFIDA